MSKPTIRRTVLVPALVLAAVAILGVAPRPGEAASAAAPAWPAQDALILDMAKAPVLSAAQKDALLKTLGDLSAARPAGPAVTMDYPAPGSLFPPDMVAPTFLFHDGEASARTWLAAAT